MTTSSTTLAQKSFERADPRFFGVPTEELLLDVSWIRQSRLDTIEDPDLAESTRCHTIEYLDHRAAPIIRELKRRHDQHLRHKGKPHVNRWPDVNQYEKTLKLARELKAAIPLASYVDSVFPESELKRQGNSWKGRCVYPDHEDRTPSFVVYDDHFKCFGCEKQGDIYALVALADNLERFADRVASLASWAGLVARS